MIRFALLALTCAGTAYADTASKAPKGNSDSRSSKEFIEERKNLSENPYLQRLRESRSLKEKSEVNIQLIESSRQDYLKYNNRVRVPGFISATPLPQVAKVVGPSHRESTSFRLGDTIYLRWSGAPMPKIGDRFATFTPAVVLQNLLDPTDFEVFLPLGPLDKLPKDRRMAGYFYETTGRIRTIKIRGGLVEATIEQLSGQLAVGDEIMEVPPLVENITPISSGVQLSAAVVCGSPHDRLSTTRRSIIYINRGSRDGIRVGRVFESVEAVPLDESVRGTAPELSNGEAIVIHTTDAYSTAMITKQFDVIRMGSLLRTKQEESPISKKSPFEGFADMNGKETESAPTEKLPEVTSLDNLPGKTDDSLPEPRKRPSAPQLSELDELERGLDLRKLSPEEKSRLETLGRQEKIGVARTEDMEPEEDIPPGSQTVGNSFKDGKKSTKKEGKKLKKRTKNDEEELNLLMMQN